jgi:hypothetical protein
MTHITRHLLHIAIAAAFLLTAVFVAQPGTALADTTAIHVGDIWFCDDSFQGGVCETTINAGDSIVWDFAGANLPHTSTACGSSCDSPTSSPLWDSGVIGDSGSYEYTFNEPGTYLYYCQVHPTLQRGKITVRGDGGSGDVNCSGAADSVDAALILQFGAGLVSSLSCQENADVNGDGTINAIDAALVLQFTAGLLPSLPP